MGNYLEIKDEETGISICFRVNIFVANNLKRMKSPKIIKFTQEIEGKA